MNEGFDKIFLGRIVSTHGVKGYFKVNFYSGSELEFLSYKNSFMIEKDKIDIEKKFKKGKLLICSSRKVQSKSEASIL